MTRRFNNYNKANKDIQSESEQKSQQKCTACQTDFPNCPATGNHAMDNCHLY